MPPKTRKEWIAECEFKRRHIEARKLATPEEVASFWPRSKSASHKEEWIHAWGRLMRLLAREENRVGNMDFTDADARITKALTGEPVGLMVYPVGGVPTEVRVHPKSFHVLSEFFHARDWLLLQLAARVDVLREKGTFEDYDLLTRANAELIFQQQLLAAAACTEGPTLPEDIWAGKDVSEFWRSVTPADLLRINQAYVYVNHTQLEALEVLVQAGKRGGRDRPSWSIFFGSLATKMNIPAERLMKDHALVSLLATVKLSQPDEESDEKPEPAGVR